MLVRTRQTGHVLDVALADGVAATHLAAIGIMLVGGLLSWRWPRVAWVHAPLTGVFLAVHLARVDCPLTTLELYLRQRAGERPYQGGFIAHYLVAPVHPAGITPGIRLAIYAIAIAPNAVGYGLLCARWLARTGVAAGTRPA